jgi:microcystin-dependent protein
MTTPYIAELRIFAFNFAPRNWALCNGQTMSISQNQALFALLGTTYGGNGQTTFQLPNLQGRIPVHVGTGYNLGTTGGEETHTLVTSEIPQHTHQMRAKNASADINPNGRTPAATVTPAIAQTGSPGSPVAVNMYSSGTANETMAPQAIGNGGSSTGHENRQPFLTMNVCIALQGLFPSRN